MNKRKIAVLFLASILMVSAVTAASFGSFSSNNEKEIDSLSTKFKITVFNTGDQPLQLEITSTDVEGGNVVHPNTISLEPSRVTKNPSSDSKWFLASDGRYIETTEIPVELLIDRERAKDNFDFTVKIKASSSGESDGGIFQNIAQVRSYSYHVETTAAKTGSGSGSVLNPEQGSNQPGQSGSGSNPSGQSGGGLISNSVQGLADSIGGLAGDLDSSSENSKSKEQTGENKPSQVESTGQASGEEKPDSGTGGQKATGEFFQASGVNSVTVMMLLTLVGSTLYLIRVI